MSFRILLVLVLSLIFSSQSFGQSVARQWNELLIDAIRVDTPRPTVHSRNLFHVSSAMYDAWASYDSTAVGYFRNEQLNGTTAAQEEAMSYAAYRVLSSRFADSPGGESSLPSFDAQMNSLGYDASNTSTIGDSPAAVGNRIAQTILQFGLTDGSNEQNGFSDTSGYVAVNPPMDVATRGTTLPVPNRWQPLTIGGDTQEFLTPHWGNVTGFAAPAPGSSGLTMDATKPPQLGGVDDDAFKAAVVEVIHYSYALDASDGQMVDISPANLGANTLGTNDGTGHAINPVTGQPYAANVVPLGDYGRVLAEFWADGPQSETPPGHWNTLLNEVADHPALVKQFGGTGPVVSDLEWDVKSYFALNGAVHDAAIVAWDNKEYYDYVRPISMIRYMGGLGQSTDTTKANYHEDGLPLEAGLIEEVTSATTSPGERHEHLAGNEGEIALKAWTGPPSDSASAAGVDWILAEDWMPYQADDFVTPGFAGYTSGHSTFSRAAAEILTAITGDEYFPGGFGEFTAVSDTSLGFEDGPTQDVHLQWATYYDAADEAGISRLYGGIHVEADDLLGRVTGAKVGIEAFDLATNYFNGVPEPSSSYLLLVGIGLLFRTVRKER